MVFCWFLSCREVYIPMYCLGCFLLSFLQDLAVISEASKLHQRKAEQIIAELVI